MPIPNGSAIIPPQPAADSAWTATTTISAISTATGRLQFCATGSKTCGQQASPTFAPFARGTSGQASIPWLALSILGIAFDASHNACFADERGVCRVAGETPVHDRSSIAGVVEIPVTCFDDRIFGMRPLQVCSVSLAEMRNGLRLAYGARRHTAVVVSHGFELLNRSRSKANPMHVARFVGLCHFLADHRGTMPTMGFADLDPDTRGMTPAAVPLRSSVLFTLPRIGMQLLGRIYG